MSDIARPSGDNSYAGLQRKLKTFAVALETASEALGKIQKDMRDHASLATATATQLGEAGGDERYVDLTDTVATLLGEAATQTQRTKSAADTGAAAARAAADTHRAKYGALDEIRTSRTTKTPKPGFFS
ncbi:conjugal transfer protein TraB [Streptomyces sp. NBC_01233]|uniref:conjugal transfer protein TraB n=1 Tax=Streptomyces sp. NBC_01233 TaxID=2903787 RepID=UPI002E136399|nr:conjugal transfer protein TraB [Streptomyces sp. NBC_01233]